MSDANNIGENSTNGNEQLINYLFDRNAFPASLEPIPKLTEVIDLGGLNAHSEIQENSSTQEEETVSQLTILNPVPPVQTLRVDSEYDNPLLGNPIDDANLGFGFGSCDDIDLPSPLFEDATNEELDLEAILQQSGELSPSEEESRDLAEVEESGDLVEVEESAYLAEVEEEPSTSTALPQLRKRKSSQIIREIGNNMDLTMAARSSLREDAMRQSAGSNKQNVENVRAETVISAGTMKAPKTKGRQKKIKMHQLPDVNDPKIKRAKMARENREKKKQAEMELTEKNAELSDQVHELTKEVEKCRGKISELGHANLHLQNEKEKWIAEREELKASLQMEIDRNEKLQAELNKDVATPEQTVEIIDSFKDIVSRLPNHCEIEVKSGLAEMRVPVLSNEKVQEIRQNKVHAVEHETTTTHRALKFKGVFDLIETKAIDQSELMTVPDTDDHNFD